MYPSQIKCAAQNLNLFCTISDYVHATVKFENRHNLEVCTDPGLPEARTRQGPQAGPADERGFFRRAGPGRPLIGDFSNGPGRVWLQKKEDE